MKTFRFPIFCSQRFLYQLLLLICICRVQNTKAQSWQSLGGGASFSVYALAVDSVRDELYVGGWFDRVGNTYVNGIAKWDGQNWQVLNGGVNNGGLVKTILVYNNEIYAGGNFDSIGGIAANNIARWDQTSWHPIGTGFDSYVNSLIVHNDTIYAGGGFNYSGQDTAQFIAKWNGHKWLNQGFGLSSDAIALYSYNNQLLAGGLFGNKYWNDTTWKTMGSNLGGIIYGYCLFQGELYICGNFRNSTWPFKRLIAKWDGQDWQPWPYPIYSGTLDPGIRSIHDHNGMLTIIGSFNSPNNIAKYNGLSLDSFSVGISADGLCLATYKNELIVGGIFNYAGNQVPDTKNLARWTIVNTLGSLNNPQKAFSIFSGSNSFYFKIPINFERTNHQLVIYNTYGQIIFNQKNFFGEDLIIDKLNNGIYLINIYNNLNKVFTSKFIISH